MLTTLKRIRKSAVAILVVLIVALVTFVCTEILFQNMLFSDIGLMKPLKRPDLYADMNSSSDFWKLQGLFSGLGKGQTTRPQRLRNYDSRLGWVNPLIRPESYQHADATKMQSRTPVLLYGDSFAQCSTLVNECFQGVLNADTRFNRLYYLLNYGVWGYGLDQIYLLYLNSVDLYRNPLVIISLLPEDIDRSLLTVRDGPKPYFELEKGDLKLRGVPVDPYLNHFYSSRKPNIKSYLLSMFKVWAYENVRVLLPRRVSWQWRSDSQQIPLSKELNRTLIAQIASDLRRRGIRHMFVIFDRPEDMFRPMKWRHKFLFQVMNELQIPYISARQLIEGRETKSAFRPDRYWFSTEDHHPSALYNRLLSQEMVRWVTGSGGLGQENLEEVEEERN